IPKISRESAGQGNISNQFVSSQNCLLVARVKVSISHAALPTHRNQSQFCFVGKQRRQGIGSGRSVGDIATQCSAILICDSAGPASNGQPLSWLARQQGKNGRQIAGRDKFVFGWIGSHFVTLRRAAFDTASKICM